MSRISKADRQLREQGEAGSASLYASRVRVYPMAVHGPMRRIKWAVLSACLGIYYVLPWIRWDRGPGRPDQALLLDLWNERFYILGLELWPQDITYLAGLLIMGAVGLFFVTSLFGRVWCGYACPQTVWTDLFMGIERGIEGDRNERMRRDAQPLSFDKIWRKVLKHAVWLGIAFWTGGAWIMYYVDAPTVTRAFWTGTASTAVYLFTGLFTLTTYTLAGWAREQVCTYMCPWPRFQSAMLDEQSFTVTYRAWRGEPRMRGKRAPDQTAGDCVDCGACVAACPTGIDIRDGIQLECINCGLCMDACNHVMQKLGREEWLIAWDTLARQAAKCDGKPAPIKLLRPRTMIYIAALSLAIVVMAATLFTRHHLGISLQRDRAPLFVTLPDGALRNGYTLRILNKGQVDGQYQLRVIGLPDARLAVAEWDLPASSTLTLPVGRDEAGTFRLLVTARPDQLRDGAQPVEFQLRELRSGEEAHYQSVFLGPKGFNPAVQVS